MEHFLKNAHRSGDNHIEGVMNSARRIRDKDPAKNNMIKLTGSMASSFFGSKDKLPKSKKKRNRDGP